MLYVFHVDVGRMMTFDMTVALSSVENLKETIERIHGIPASKIVLLVSGGEMLTQSTQVSYYSAGTDTNPIYMFLIGEVRAPATVSQLEPDLDLREQVERCRELPAVYETVMTRAQLALRMYDLARDEERVCERLVHHQHLQQQGWSAVVANMEDLTDEFRERFRNFCSSFDRHLEQRDTYLKLLHNFDSDLTQLSRIPILPGLMPLAEQDFHGFDEFLDTDEVFSRSGVQQESVLVATAKEVDGEAAESSKTISGEDKSSTTSPNKKLKTGNENVDDTISTSQQSSTMTSSSRRRSLNLLQWITSKENHNMLKVMSDECNQGLGTFNIDVYEKLKTEVQNIIKLAVQGDVKEIKGLGDRLCRLEEFKYKIKSMVQDQKELSTAFQQNQNRAINLRDASILPDLCASHQSQLVVMLQNHQKIRDHRRCIAKAKDELGSNLHTRLKRIVFIENTMSEFDNRLLFYHRCLRRAERHICIIDQIHQAPSIYIAAVTEVVRRKIFSGEFQLWASKLAEDFDAIHSEEVQRRQIFNASFEGHFLNILFPGMNDMPPAFANEHPLAFDSRLPNITKSDIDLLSTQLPDLATQIRMPDMAPVIDFFVARSGEHQRDRFEELLKQHIVLAATAAAVSTAGGREKLLHQRVGELQRVEAAAAAAEESETDTETEFETVPASLQTVATSTSENDVPATETIARSTLTERLETQNVATLTEEDYESPAHAELGKLRAFLSEMSKISLDCLGAARDNLQSFRSDTIAYQDDLQSELHTLKDKWTMGRMRCLEREQQLQSFGEEQAAEVAHLRERLAAKDNEINERAADAETLRIKCDTLDAQLGELRDQLRTVQRDKDFAVAAAREELIHEHKTEIESLRCRFKLMTSMERSPSDTSLEKVERPTSAAGDHHPLQMPSNVIETALHEALLAQLRATLEEERNRAVTVAIEMERSLWQTKIFPMNSETVMTKMLEEKERLLDQLRERDLMLTKENYQLKTRLDALTNEEGNSWLREKIEYLNRDKNRLEEELNMEKSRRQEMETSFAAVKNTGLEQPGSSGSLPRSKGSGSSNQKYVVLDTCAKDDIVFVVWSMRHGQFMVVQDSQTLYFVHGESLAALNLCVPPPPEHADEVSIPRPYYALGRVVEKEYCLAKKDENRYRVTRGSKFYRIKLAPLVTRQSARQERLESFAASVSRSLSQCDSQSDQYCSVPSVRQPQVGLSVVDAPAVPTSGATVVTTGTTDAAGVSASTVRAGNKERTTSFTSVTEEDDEPVSLLSERCRYISVSEEEETSLGATAATAAVTAEEQQQIPSSSSSPPQATQQTVITEQPTASIKLKMDLLLASTDITDNGVQPEEAQQPPPPPPPVVVVASATPTTAIFIPVEVAPGGVGCTHSVPASVGTTSEDSDEYRSLEGKDDTDFPGSE